MEDINLAKEITEAILQKKFQDAINQKTNDLTSILNHSNACIYITNLSANILNINSEACLCFQIYKNCSGQPLFNFIKDKNFQSNFTKSLKFIQKTKKAISIEEEVNLNGESHFFTTVRFPLFNHNSQIYSVCTISSSINKLKKNEKKLKFINKELDSMSYFLAHDLSRPIRHISNYANLIIDELKENNIENTQIYEYIAHIIKSNEYLIKMIESILMISKIEEQCNTTFLENPIEIIKEIFDDSQNADKNTLASLEFYGALPP